MGTTLDRYISLVSVTALLSVILKPLNFHPELRLRIQIHQGSHKKTGFLFYSCVINGA
jgi:hypothetical protein